MIEPISTTKAPEAVGPYSQAVRFENLVFCSGQVSVDASSGEIQRGTVAEQTRKALENISAVLEASGSSLENVLKTTVYLSDMKDFNEMNSTYASYFKQHFPARLTVEVKSIYAGLAVEIDAIAAVQR